MGQLATWLKDYSKDLEAAEKAVATRIKSKTAKPLGKGTYGTAFDIGGKKVLKLTADKTEANAMAVVQANPSPYVVKVYDVFQLGKKHTSKNVYGIVQDKLSPPDAGWVKFVNQIPAAILYYKPGHLTIKAFVKFYKSLQKEREVDDKYLPDFTDQRLEWLSALARYFDGAGIKFHDFHKGNVMKKGSKHVMIDLGASKSPAAKIPVQESYSYEMYELDYAMKEFLKNPCAGTRYAMEMARAALDLESSEPKERKLSLELIERLVEGKTRSTTVDEATIVSLMWRRLPSSMRNKVDMKEMQIFIERLEDGASLADASRAAGLTPAVGVELMTQIERMGLL